MSEPHSSGTPKPGIKMAPRRSSPAEQSSEPQNPKIHQPENSTVSIRKKLLQTFGNVVAFLVDVPRYRSHSIGDLQYLILEPLVRDRVLLVRQATSATQTEPDVTAVVIWASVSEIVNAKIHEQIKAGVFPVRLLPDDWASGNVHWLLDIVARSPDVAKQAVANFGQVTKSDRLNLHPAVNALLDKENLEKLGVKNAATQHVSNT